MQKPKIIVASTGGTIASKIGQAGGYSPEIDAKGLLAYCPSWMREQIDLIPIAYCNLLSFALMPESIFDLVMKLADAVQREGALGAVITQGTASIEETSFLADILWRESCPLVFTGAMRNASHPGWDGPSNLFHSLLTVLNPESRDQGALVCMDGEVFAARDVSKRHKSALNAFGSYNAGPLGFVSGGRVVFRYSVKNRVVLNPKSLEMQVELIAAALGTTGKLIDAAVEMGARAIALEVFPGGGGVPPAMFETIARHLRNGIIFTMSQRSPMGSDNYSKSSGGCGPWDMRREGVIPCGSMSAAKARLVLMAALPYMKKREELADLFASMAP
jgi:L-asparaginase